MLRLQESQTEITAGSRWTLRLQGDALRADRLLSLEALAVSPAPGLPPLFDVPFAQLKSGDRVALVGRNGSGKSSLLRLIWQHHCQQAESAALKIHPRARMGYYDQTLHQLADDDSLHDALEPFAASPRERMLALMNAGFERARHGQTVSTLSGGERSRLLFVGLSLASYSLLLLDEPTNHLDMEGNEALAETLASFAGGALLVSHDRQLIERACNRFWRVDGGRLEALYDAQALWESMSETPAASTAPIPTAESAVAESDGDLLTRLIELETRLADDLARRPRHQKPQLQVQWRQQIEELLAKI